MPEQERRPLRAGVFTYKAISSSASFFSSIERSFGLLIFGSTWRSAGAFALVSRPPAEGERFRLCDEYPPIEETGAGAMNAAGRESSGESKRGSKCGEQGGGAESNHRHQDFQSCELRWRRRRNASTRRIPCENVGMILQRNFANSAVTYGSRKSLVFLLIKHCGLS